MKKIEMEDIVKYCAEYGYIFRGSDIYGGLANTWDYGPMGVRLKNNIKDLWRKEFIQKNDNSYEIDAGILMNPRVWEASGHVDNFSDPMIDCKDCKSRYRVDTFINNHDENVDADNMSIEEMAAYIKDNNLSCQKCGSRNFTDIKKFKLMFETNRGTTDKNTNTVYLRPENAQGEYVNYSNVMRTMHEKLPFSIGQIGKAFRNEITPGNFTFRTVEFEQMEFQTFCKKGQDSELYEFYKKKAMEFIKSLGIPDDKLRFHDHEKLAFYAKAACDIEYQFPFGWGEVNGTHNRTDYDLSRHQEYSGKKLEYFDQVTGERFIPYIIESTCGADRLTLMAICEALKKYDHNNTERIVLELSPELAPYKISVLPLIKKKHSGKALEIYKELRNYLMCYYDDSNSIGKRYRKSDAYGTPYAITIDDDTLEDNTVTIRNRDTMEQERISVKEISEYAPHVLKKTK